MALAQEENRALAQVAKEVGNRQTDHFCSAGIPLCPGLPGHWTASNAPEENTPFFRIPEISFTWPWGWACAPPCLLQDPTQGSESHLVPCLVEIRVDCEPVKSVSTLVSKLPEQVSGGISTAPGAVALGGWHPNVKEEWHRSGLNSGSATTGLFKH